MTPERLRQILEQTIAAAYTSEQMLPATVPPFVTAYRNEMVTVLPTKAWTELVFAINELTARRPGGGHDSQ